MTIWLLALILLASLAGLGYRQGAIRVAFSLVAIFLGVLLAVPLGKPAAILLKAFGVVNPVLLWLLPPFVVFCVISAIFKSVAQVVHHKVEVHFKYKAGDLRLSLWERLNRRLGLCLGIVNGVAYLILISFVISIFSYWTMQMETSEGMARSVRLLNRLGSDLQSTGFVKTARALDRMPESYYEAADVTGLLFQNSLLEARLSRYPAFLMLGEKTEFQTLANDQEFTAMRVRQSSVSELLAYAPVKAITGNPEMLNTIWGIAKPNLKDLETFLKTGQSPVFNEEPILGRWNFDARGTVAAMRRDKPNMTATEMRRARAALALTFTKTRLVVGTDNQLVVKDYPNMEAAQPPTQPGQPVTIPTESSTGTWDGANGHYQLTFTIGGKEMKGLASIEGERITITVDHRPLAFEREY